MRNRLAALHTLPTDAPVTGSDECRQLFELLTVVRMTAEREVVGRLDTNRTWQPDIFSTSPYSVNGWRSAGGAMPLE